MNILIEDAGDVTVERSQGQFVSVVMDLFNGGDLVDGLNLHRRVRGAGPMGSTGVHGVHFPTSPGRYGGFHKWGTPKWMVYRGKPQLKMDELGVPLFEETPIWWLYMVIIWWLYGDYMIPMALSFTRTSTNTPQPGALSQRVFNYQRCQFWICWEDEVKR